MMWVQPSELESIKQDLAPKNKIVEQNFLTLSTYSLAPKHTLQDIAYDYLQHRLPSIEQTSHFNNKRVFDTCILPHYKKKTIEEITKLDCRRFVDKMAMIKRTTKTETTSLH